MSASRDGRLELLAIQYSGGGDTATVGLRVAYVREEAGIGVGTIDATVKAMLKLLERIGEPLDVELQGCRMESVGVGSEASGQVIITLAKVSSEERYTGTGTDVDINKAAALAVVDALNSARGHKSGGANGS